MNSPSPQPEPVSGQRFSSFADFRKKQREGTVGPAQEHRDGPPDDRAVTTPPTPTATATPTSTSTPSTARGADPHPGRAALDFGTTSATVTLWDPGVRSFPPLSPDQRRGMADAFADLLTEEPDDPELRPVWREVRDTLAARLDRWVHTGTDPAEVLRSEHGSGELLDQAIGELERFRENRGAALRRFLTPRLQRCYEAGLDVPPLDTLRHFRVYLDGKDKEELPSVVHDTGRSDGRRFTLLPPAGQESTATRYRGLKQQLGRQVPRGVGADGGPGLTELVGGALGDLVQRTDDYLTRFRDERSFAPGLLNSVVVTYPTMVPLTVRDNLEQMLRAHGVAHVDTRFDEAIAAAMFYLLREVGGTFEMSVEAFAARCRPLPDIPDSEDRPLAWQQDVLIVDVGGGTTDVALLHLELHDETERTTIAARSPHYGRYFRLKPTILGTTGESQRGGDYLTLQVFRWLKVLLADQLLVAAPDAFTEVAKRLDERYVDADGNYIGGKLSTVALGGLAGMYSAARAAEWVVPTAWRDNPPGKAGKADEQEQLFGTMWDLAEATKRRLGSEAEVPIDATTARNLLRGIWEMHARNGSAPEPVALRLRRSDFEALVADEVGNVMHLAAALTHGRLDGRAPDRVILTGRGALLPLVRTQLVRALAAHDGDQPNDPDRRRPPITCYPDRYAKHAASIGACWAAGVDRRLQRNVADRLAEGVTWMTIDVDNMFRSLRGTFEELGPNPSGSKAGTPLFSTGEPLRPREPGGEPVARSRGWIQYDNGFRVHRRKVAPGSSRFTGKSTVTWAHFSVHDHLQMNPIEGFHLDRDDERELYVQVEVTAGLDMTALVCREGRPHVELPARRSSAAVYDELGGTPGPTPTPFPAVPATIVVDSDQGGSTHDARPRPTFAADDAFDVTLVVDGATLAGVRSGPLPEPSEAGWRFSRRDIGPDGIATEALLALVAVPDGPPELGYHAVLDELGTLYVVAGEPPYRRAEDLAEVFRTAGTVLRVPMTADEPDYREADDPFTGKQ